MTVNSLKMARRLTLPADAFEIIGLTTLVVLSVVFLASLGVVNFAPLTVLAVQLTLSTAICAFIQSCARRQSLAVLAAVKDRIADELTALRG